METFIDRVTQTSDQMKMLRSKIIVIDLVIMPTMVIIQRSKKNHKANLNVNNIEAFSFNINETVEYGC